MSSSNCTSTSESSSTSSSPTTTNSSYSLPSIVYVKDARTHRTHPIALSSPVLVSMENVLQRSGGYYHQYSFTNWNDVLISSLLLRYYDENTLLSLTMVNRDCINTLRAHPVWLSLPFAKYLVASPLADESTANTSSNSSSTVINLNSLSNLQVPLRSSPRPSTTAYSKAFYLRRMLAYRNQAILVWQRIDTYYRILVSTEWNEGITIDEFIHVTKILSFLLHPSLVGSLLIRNGNIRDRDIVTNHMAIYGARLLSGKEIVQCKREQPLPPGVYPEAVTVTAPITPSSVKYTVPISAVFGHKQLWMDSKLGTVYLCQPLHDPITVGTNFISFLESTLR